MPPFLLGLQQLCHWLYSSNTPCSAFTQPYFTLFCLYIYSFSPVFCFVSFVLSRKVLIFTYFHASVFVSLHPPLFYLHTPLLRFLTVYSSSLYCCIDLTLLNKALIYTHLHISGSTSLPRSLILPSYAVTLTAYH